MATQTMFGRFVTCEGDPEFLWIVSEDGERLVALVPLCHENRHELGRLLSAAPELVHELRRLVRLCDTDATLPDGSNPDTLAAHKLLDRIDGVQDDEG